MKSTVVGKSAGSSRLIELIINNKTLLAPTYFPAISSFGIKYSFSSLLSLFLYYKFPRVLISAYDWYFLPDETRNETLSELEKYRLDSFVFMDSGIFESYWKDDKRWKIKLHQETLAESTFDLHTSFDILPSQNCKDFVNETIDAAICSREQCDKAGFIPVIHGNPDEVLLITKRLVKSRPDLCNFIALPERDCGESIMEKAHTIHEIRKIMDSGEDGTGSRMLHLLGCGDPLSMLLFVYAGASSFDSLDWIKFCADPDQLFLHNFSHLELLNCDCVACSRKGVPYVEKVFLHNLLFYQNYVLRLQELINEDSLGKLLEEHFSKTLLGKVLQ